MTVKQWPSYLLRSIPHDTRTQMTARALRDGCSLADVARQAICHRYKMNCEHASSRYQPQLDTGNDVLIIRLQPDAYRKLKRETGQRYGAIRHVILESLTDYLEAT